MFVCVFYGLSSPTRCDGTSVLCGVTRVGLVAKGLLIKGDLELELVLMCREKPSKLLLYTISANLPLQIQVPSATPSTPGFRDRLPHFYTLKTRTHAPTVSMFVFGAVTKYFGI